MGDCLLKSHDNATEIGLRCFHEKQLYETESVFLICTITKIVYSTNTDFSSSIILSKDLHNRMKHHPNEIPTASVCKRRLFMM